MLEEQKTITVKWYVEKCFPEVLNNVSKNLSIPHRDMHRPALKIFG